MCVCSQGGNGGFVVSSNKSSNTHAHTPVHTHTHTHTSRCKCFWSRAALACWEFWLKMLPREAQTCLAPSSWIWKLFTHSLYLSYSHILSAHMVGWALVGVSVRLYWHWRVYFNALLPAERVCMCVKVCACVCVFANFYIEIYHTKNFSPASKSVKRKVQWEKHVKSHESKSE